MQKVNDLNDQFKILGEQNLPLLPQRRKNKGEEWPKQLHNSRSPSKIHVAESTQPQITNNKSPSSVFHIPKGTLFIDRRLVPTPARAARNKGVQNIEAELLKRRITELRSLQQELPSQEPFFNQVLKEFGLIQESDWTRGDEIQKQTQNYSYKKRIQQRKLRPIISETEFKNNKNHQFFNVEKVTLLSVQGKKSRSMLVDTFEAPEESSLQRELNRHKIFSDFEGHREKIKRTVMVIDDRKEQLKEQGNSLIIKTMEPKSFDVSRNDFSQRRFSESIAFKEVDQKAILTLTHKEVKETREKMAFRSAPKDSKDKQIKDHPKPLKRFKKKFQPPYPTYNYRHLLWKVNYTNRMFVQHPLQYEHRLKVFVGKGNNSCMVIGLISRRPWFAFTDKIEEAHFAWTQLKQLSFFKRQVGCQQTKVEEHRGSYMPSSIFRDVDDLIFKSYFRTYLNSEEHADERMVPRSKYFKYQKIIKGPQIRDQRMHNHLINNYVLGNKKALFNTMANYYRQIEEDVFKYLPLTFHIKEGLEDQRYFEFLKYYHKRSKQIAKQNHEKGRVKEYNAWIVKPGENSNRGHGIKMCLTLDQIKAVLKKRDKYNDGSSRTYIIQAYIERPLLYFKRKFDLRHYIMITCVNGLIKGYWYREGYVRTTSNEYSLKDNSGGIHLTNDAVQKNLSDYGKYQKGNKISYEDLSTYIEKYSKKSNKGFFQSIYPKMRRMAADSIRAASGGIDPAKLSNNFQIFGMDFMIDSNLDVWLIEINTNPCLQLSCPLLGCIIPRMVQDALELTLDAMFPPPQRFSPKGMHYYKQLQKQNKFELIYDERVEKLYKGSLQVLDNKLLEEEDDTFEDCGEDWQDN